MKKPLIILTGPTAVGKTKLSVLLASAVNGEIISADSMQVYKYMNIGSAKIRPDEMGGIPHYLVDVLDPRDDFNVVRFQQMAKQALETIYQNGRIPIIVGGTGFYIQALLKDIDFDENPSDSSYRSGLEDLAAQKGGEFLHQQLQAADPQAALEIHPNNTKRVIRALEFYHQTGRKISEHNQEQKEKEPPFQYLYFVLNDRREKLYEQIDRRIDQMIEEGLLDEVKELYQSGYTRDLVSMQGLGYKEIIDYLDGHISWEEAVYTLKRDTRHFAKRQLTWFKREKSVEWIEKESFNYDDGRILAYIIRRCREENILKNEEQL